MMLYSSQTVSKSMKQLFFPWKGLLPCQIKLKGRIRMKMNLRKKLFIGGALLAFIPMLVIGIFSTVKITNTITNLSDDLGGQTVEQLASTIRSIMDKELTQAKAISAARSITKGLASITTPGNESAKIEIEELNQEFRGILPQLGNQYSSIFVTDAKGIAVAGVTSDGSTKGLVGVDFSDRDYFKAVKQEGKAGIGSIVKSKVTNQPVMVVCSPIRTEKGDFAGVLALTSKVDLLINLVVETKVGQTGYSFLIDAQGNIIAHPKRELILNPEMASDAGLQSLIKKMSSQQKGTFSYSYEGKERVACFAPVGVKSWSLATVQPKEEFQSGIRAFRNQEILLGGLLLVTALLLVFLFGRSVSGPVARVATGLSKVFNRVAAVSGQVSSASHSLAEGSSEQAASIEETSSSLEEMSSMTKQNADNAHKANQLMMETREIVLNAGQSMEKLSTSMGEISKASEETSKIIKTIDEIAFQTNLLALNAAVEAARAGEAGAGFAVVADEVRNLALRAAEAAKNTAGMIEGTVKKVKEGTDLVAKAETGFREVAVSVKKSSELVDEISAASREQAQGIEQVNTAVNEMDKVVQQNAASAEESASASEEMNSQAEQMRLFVEDLNLLVTGLKEVNHDPGKIPEKKIVHSQFGGTRKANTGSRKSSSKAPKKLLSLRENISDF
jgi:methyl-accepting chemotaxis protein